MHDYMPRGYPSIPLLAEDRLEGAWSPGRKGFCVTTRELCEQAILCAFSLIYAVKGMRALTGVDV